LEPDLELEAREMLAQAHVAAVPEGEVPTRVTTEIECVGVAELLRVAVRGGQRDRDALSCSDPNTSELNVVEGSPREGTGLHDR
jgi:hypothetical protein